MTEEEFCDALRRVGHGDRSFSVLRSSAANRPLASSEQIADQLEEEIAREILPPGTHLRETALAERFGVSRGPIRDALRLLDGDALVRLSPNRGAIVTSYSAADLRHIADLSRPITRLHLGIVAERISGETMQEQLAAQRRIGTLLHRDDPVAFALAVAMLTMKQSHFATGQFGEKILQLLYRPSIRYTVAGLQRAGARERAELTWRKHMEATENRDSEQASGQFLKMLREIHLPVLERKP